MGEADEDEDEDVGDVNDDEDEDWEEDALWFSLFFTPRGQKIKRSLFWRKDEDENVLFSPLLSTRRGRTEGTGFVYERER